MRQVSEIKAAYDWMVGKYQSDLSSAVSANDTAATERLDSVRDKLERGVFVMLFGQFERLVTECFEQTRDTRSADPNWGLRRGWDLPAYQGRRVPFETKLALVVDRRHREHSRITGAYGLRNHCAHGGTSEPVGSIDQFVADLQNWERMIQESLIP